MLMQPRPIAETFGPELPSLRCSIYPFYRTKPEPQALDDEIDEIVFSRIDKYGDVDLKAVNKASTSEDLKDEDEPDKTEALKPLLEKLKTTLGDRVKDVRASVRLADSPSCIVSEEEEPSMADAARADELNAKSNEGLLTEDERAELEAYVNVGDLLAYWQSKARQLLQQP